jgi:hypothetical protein
MSVSKNTKFPTRKESKIFRPKKQTERGKNSARGRIFEFEISG